MFLLSLLICPPRTGPWEYSFWDQGIDWLDLPSTALWVLGARASVWTLPPPPASVCPLCLSAFLFALSCMNQTARLPYSTVDRRQGI